MTRYAKNLEKFAKSNPLEAFAVDQADCSHLKPCKTYYGELNLRNPNYLHAQEGAELEARYWAKGIPLQNVDTVFVFGLGLGYYYLALKEWLLSNPKAYLVFVEDDAAIIRCFLETQLASEILGCPNVLIKLVPNLENTEMSWQRFRVATFDITKAFAQKKVHLGALQSYFGLRFEIFDALNLRLRLNFAEAERVIIEYLIHSDEKFRNFYANIPYMGMAARGSDMGEALKGIPAVVCGAGPSLAKQLPLITALDDRALIIGAGSGVNALTNASIMPHVAGAIDPTEAQGSRMLTSYAFDVPAFYQNSFYHHALVQWHGPLIYMARERTGFRVGAWFEDMLGIPASSAIPAGESTTNFLTDVAGFLRCDPVVLVGVDLAYTNDSRYVKGVTTHPADDPMQKKALEGDRPAVLPVPGVSGEEVYTKLMWLYEGGYFIEFKKQHPEILFLNATEGGMPIPTVENVKFSKVTQELLVDSWDVSGWLHGVVQNAYQDRIAECKVMEAIDRWYKSLKRCDELLDLLLKEKSGRAALWQVELEEEEVYEYFLKTLNVLFESTIGLKRSKGLERKRYRFFKGYVKRHLKYIEQGMKDFRKHQSQSKHVVRRDPRKTELINYPTDAPRIPETQKIKGAAAVAMYNSHGEREGQMLCFYPEGTIKAEAFYRAGKLHGPWTFYGKSGIVLYRSCYVDGQRRGKCQAFYADGSLYREYAYRNGVLDGEYLCYYSDGVLKTAVAYVEGKLHGVLRLYYANGRMKKEQHFSHGRLHGTERIWNPAGKLVVEAEYANNRPLGVSRKWNKHGKLEREIVH